MTNEQQFPPVQGLGFKDGRRPDDIPDGYVRWEEHYEAWAQYAKAYPGPSAEDVANKGGFTYKELREYLGHHPTTWTPRDTRRFADYVREGVDVVEDPPAATPSLLRSHIVFVNDETPICKNPASVPDSPINFDSADAAHCSACLRKIHTWVAGWINDGRNIGSA